MQLDMIRLGRMSANMVRRLLKERGEADYQDKLLSAMRFGFGGHLEKKPAE